MDIDLEAVRATVRAARKQDVYPHFVLESIDDQVVGELIDPLIEAAGGPDPVIDALAPHKGDSDIAEALWYLFFLGDPDYYGADQRNMLTVFSEEEIVEAAVQLLVEFREDHFTDERGLPQWGWDALCQHEYDEEDHLPSDAAFRMFVAVVERVPMDDKILWMVGDGPLSKAWADPEYRERIKDLARTEPKVRRAIELDEDYWRRGADPYEAPSLEGLH